MRAVENALGITIPDNARIIRNLISGIQYVQDHVIHFYHLHALDWVDIVSALKADPVKTSHLAQSISDWPKSSADYFRTVQQKLKTFVESGQLGIFANATGDILPISFHQRQISWQLPIILKPLTGRGMS